MAFNLQTIVDSFAFMSSWEIIAALFGIAYILLATKESLWTWFFAFFGTLIYTILFWEGALISSSILNFYYMIMAIYGFILWRGGKESQPVSITSYHRSIHVKIITVGIISAIFLGYIAKNYFNANYPYLDAFVFVFSVVATWMFANKILENWLYWIVIDSAGIFLYFQAEYYATVVLFVVYIVLAFYGYSRWRREYRAN